jgi:hypothetical protein
MGVPLAPATNAQNAQAFIRTGGGSDKPSRNLSNVIFPTSFQQARIDLETWRNAKARAELAGWPFRDEMQKMYVKTMLNAHVLAAVTRRKELTMLRDFELRNANGEKDKRWTEYFERAWFKQTTLDLILDAIYYGYTLISIGEIDDNIPSEIVSVKRWNISPERKIVAIFESSPGGYSWEDQPYADWHLWIPTLQRNGINGCGYGLLYEVAALEILQRNNVQYNTDFIEMFAQPYRHLKTMDTDEKEMAEKERHMRDMGHNGYLITGLNDELSFLNDGSRGNGYKAYNDFDHRVKSDISKIIGGHANFIDSTTEPLAGGSQNSGGGDATRDTMGKTQVERAMMNKRMVDGDFATNVVNEQLIPKLRRLGVPIPQGMHIKFLNDSEERAIAAQEADKNQKWATLALTMAQGGLKMDGEFFTKMTGVPCSEIEVMPDKNVLTDPKEQAAGAGPLKNESMKREDKPKRTK